MVSWWFVFIKKCNFQNCDRLVLYVGKERMQRGIKIYKFLELRKYKFRFQKGNFTYNIVIFRKTKENISKRNWFLRMCLFYNMMLEYG